MPTDDSPPPNNSNSQPYKYLEVLEEPQTYKTDSRYKMGLADNFIERHKPQLISLIKSYTFQTFGSDASLEQSKKDHKNFRRFKEDKWTQWAARNSGEATDRRKFLKKFDNIHRFELGKWKQAMLASSQSSATQPTPRPQPSTSGTQLPHFAMTPSEATARSIFNSEQNDAHRQLVKKKQEEATEETRYIGQLAQVRATAWRALPEKQKAIYASKAEEERQRVLGSREECQDRLLTAIQYLVSSAVGNEPGQVGPAGFNIQYYYYNNDGSVVQGGFGLGDCANFEETTEFRNIMIPTFGSFAKLHVPSPPRIPRHTFRRNSSGIVQLPAHNDEKPEVYRDIVKEYLLTAWDDSYPHQSLDWEEFYRSHARYLVSGISSSEKEWESIEKMKLSDLFLLAENICAHQDVEGATSIFKPVPTISSDPQGSNLSSQDAADFVEPERGDIPRSHVETPSTSSLFPTRPPVSVARTPSPPPSTISVPTDASPLSHGQGPTLPSLITSIGTHSPLSVSFPSSPISAPSVTRDTIGTSPPSPKPPPPSTSTPELQTELPEYPLPGAASPRPVSVHNTPTLTPTPNSPSARINACTPPPEAHTPARESVSLLPDSPLTPEHESSPPLPVQKRNKRQLNADSGDSQPTSKKTRRQGRTQSVDNTMAGGSTRRSGRQRKEVVQGPLPVLAAPQATKCKHSWYYVTVDAEGRPVPDAASES
ncbi:hypothetical protein ONZ45_g8366 [Pleurotus djamor]|nr:hypothetical protein ONZ45_g8366 [Pleurotus djamor]